MDVKGLSGQKERKMIAKFMSYVDKLVDLPVLAKVEKQLLDKLDEATKPVCTGCVERKEEKEVQV
jgi:hypothetical protein